MKVIELLNKVANSEEVPKKIKYNDDLYTHVDNYCYFCEETNEILSQNIYAEFSRLNDEIEVIGEPKEELEEIEELDNRVAFKTTDLESGIEKEYKWDFTDIIQNTKINELIENQNKIIERLRGGIDE